MLPKKKVKLNESPEMYLITTDEAVQLSLKSVRNFKTHAEYHLVGPNQFLLFS